MATTLITALVINRDRRDDLDRCLTSIEASVGLSEPLELIVIDNASADGSAAMLAEHHPTTRLIELEVNEGFAPAVMRGTALAEGEWLAVINNDAWLEPDALARLLATGESDARIGAVTAQVRFAAAPDRINTAGLEIDALGIAYDRDAGALVADAPAGPMEVFGASGCVTLYRMAMLAETGGFDPAFFAFGEDADVAWRARMAGWRCLCDPRAVAHHWGSATAGEGSAFKYALVGRTASACWPRTPLRPSCCAGDGRCCSMTWPTSATWRSPIGRSPHSEAGSKAWRSGGRSAARRHRGGGACRWPVATDGAKH